MPNKYSNPFAQDEYERGWRAGWKAALQGNFHRLRMVELQFADGLGDPDDRGFLDAWEEAERQNLVPDNDDEEEPQPQVMRLIPA